MTDKAKGFEHWSRFWQSGALTSLSDDFSANYEGELADFWRRLFALVPEQGSILDVCTGNGAIALLAAQARPDARVHALDASHIDSSVVARQFPQFQAEVGRVQFQDGVRLEDWKGPESFYDLVCSQYGIEYSRWADSAAVVAPCIKPGGYFALVSHSPDSEMVKVMRQEARVYDCLWRVGFLDQFKAFGCGELSSESFADVLRKLHRELDRNIPGDLKAHPLVRQVFSVVVHLGKMEPAQLAAEKGNAEVYAAELGAGHARLMDMLSVNERLIEAPDWYQCFCRAGLKLESSETLYHNNRHPCGHALIFRRPTH